MSFTLIVNFVKQIASLKATLRSNVKYDFTNYV